jgi:hypothetical protein
MLSTIIKKLKDDIAATPENQSWPLLHSLYFEHNFWKLMDDGGASRYIVDDNKTPGDNKGSESNVTGWKQYVDGTWFDNYYPPATPGDSFNYPINVLPYYALVDSNMINYTHKHWRQIAVWTADYNRLEMAEPLSMAILIRAGIDTIICDDWFNIS